MSLTIPTITGYSGLWQTTGDNAPYNFMSGQVRSNSANFISKFVKKASNRDVIAALAGLIGAASGSNVTKTHKQVSSPVGPDATTPVASGLTGLGGLRTIDTITDINRNTTAADVTELKKWFSDALLEAGITYPTVVGPNISAGGGSPSFGPLARVYG